MLNIIFSSIRAALVDKTDEKPSDESVTESPSSSRQSSESRVGMIKPGPSTMRSSIYNMENFKDAVANSDLVLEKLALAVMVYEDIDMHEYVEDYEYYRIPYKIYFAYRGADKTGLAYKIAMQAADAPYLDKYEGLDSNGQPFDRKVFLNEAL